MKILITGGAGFIGSHLSEALLAEGHHIVSIDNLSTGSLANLETFKGHENFHFVEGSILDEEQLSQVFNGAEMVYHLAAAVGVKFVIENPMDSIHTNVRGTENILRLAGEKKTKVVIASTSEVYGKNDAEKLHENSDRILGATDITRWSYASSKALDEFMAFAYYRKRNLPIVIARLFNTCGPRQSSRYGMVIPRFIQQALKNEPLTVYGSGNQTRSFTYVKDTVRALIGLGFSDSCVGEVFNVGSEKATTTILELAQKIKDKVQSSSEISFLSYEEAYEHGFEDMLRRVPDVSKIRKFIDFEAQFVLEDILDNTIESINEIQAAQRP